MVDFLYRGGEPTKVTRAIGARRRIDGLHPRGWTLLAASAFGLVGSLTAAFLTVALLGRVSPGPGRTDLVVLVAGAALGAFALGGLFWWRLVEVPGAASVYRGGATGLLTGLLANFVAWFVHFLWRLVAVGMSGTPLDVLGTLAFYVLIVGGTSLVATGIVTGPVGLAIGTVLARVRRRSLDGSPSPAQPAE